MISGFIRWIVEHEREVTAGATAIGVSTLMSLRDGKPRGYTITTGCVCGIIGACITGVLLHYGLKDGWAAFIGCSVGFIGADKLRDMFIGWVERRFNVGGGKRD